jgi:hypothetical protein
VFTANAIHQCDRSREETTKGASERCGGEEDGGTNSDLVAFVPTTEVVSYSWEQSSLLDDQLQLI